MNKKISFLYLLIAILGLAECNLVFSDEVFEGMLGGGLLGGAIGGAAGGGRGAAIGTAVGAGVGAVAGSAARERRERRFYEAVEDPQFIYDQNKDLREENEQLIQKHKSEVQWYERYKWMIDQCKSGNVGYREQAKKMKFDDDTNYDKFRRWQYKESVRSQNKQLARDNSKLRKSISNVKKKIRKLKQKLQRCEEKTVPA